MKDLLAPDDTRDALRKYGGLLLGLGVLMLLLRKGDEWSNFVVFLLLGGMAVYLYGSVFTTDHTGGPRAWTAVHSVFGLIFVPLALLQFIDLVDGTSSSLNTFWIFGVTAGLAFYAGAVKGIRFHLLAGSIAAIISWSALWNKLLGDEGIAGHFGVYRGLLGILAILLLAGGVHLWRQGSDTRVTGTGVDDGGDQGLWKGSELLTGAGISAVIACSLGISSATTFLGPFGVGQFTVVETSQVWDVLLLLVGLGLVGLGAQIGTRGPVYVGSIGLFFWLLIVSLDLNEGDKADPTNLGIWPIILLVVGGAFIALSAVKESSQGDKPKQLVTKLRGN